MDEAVPYATLFVRVVLVVVFATAAVDKAGHFAKFRRTLSRLVPQRSASAVGVTICGAELAVAVALFLGPWWRLGLLVAGMLLLLFAVVLVMQRQYLAECGCGGVAEVIQGGSAGLARNLLLAVGALAAAGSGTTVLVVDSTLDAASDLLAVVVAIGTVSLTTMTVVALKLAAVRQLRKHIDAARFGEASG